MQDVSARQPRALRHQVLPWFEPGLHKAEDCIRSAYGRTSPARRAMSALRIRCFELNRGDRPGYGDSIEGEVFGRDASAGKQRLPFGASRLRVTPAVPFGTRERFIHRVRNTRSRSANRESTVASKARSRPRGSEGRFLPRLTVQDVSTPTGSRIGPHGLRVTGIASKVATIIIRPTPQEGQTFVTACPSTVSWGAAAGSGVTGSGVVSTPSS